MLLVWPWVGFLMYLLSRFPAIESLSKGQPLYAGGRKAMGLQWIEAARLPKEGFALIPGYAGCCFFALQFKVQRLFDRSG